MIQMLVSCSVDGIIGTTTDDGLIFDSEVLDMFIDTNIKGKTIVMGNTTFKGFRVNPPNSTVVVLSREIKPGIKDGIHYYNDYIEVLKDHPDFIVIGGESMFNLFRPFTDELILVMIGLILSGESFRYFPHDQLDKEFYVTQESAPVKDKEKRTGLITSLVFTKLAKLREQIH